jgi:hypothetical protein
LEPFSYSMDCQTFFEENIVGLKIRYVRLLNLPFARPSMVPLFVFGYEAPSLELLILLMVNCELKLTRGSRLVWSDGSALSRRKGSRDVSKNHVSIYVKTVDSCWHFFIADVSESCGAFAKRAHSSQPDAPRAKQLLTSTSRGAAALSIPLARYFNNGSFPFQRSEHRRSEYYSLTQHVA